MSERHSKPVVAYDGTCAFCRAVVNSWKNSTGSKVEYDDRLTEQAKHVAVALPDGEVVTDAKGVYTILSYSGFWSWLLPLYNNFKPFAALSNAGYRFLSKRRKNILSPLTKFIYGNKIEQITYSKSHALFYRLLGLVYFIAFLSVGMQIVGLVGKNGILPIGEYQNFLVGELGKAAWWQAPMVFWLGNADWFLKAVAFFGALVSVPLMLGFVSPLIMVILWASYLSLTNAGQLFMAYQWDALLLEVGFLAIFFTRNNKYFRTLFIFLLFRFILSSGIVKLLSGDVAWRDLTALNYHFFTQPLPTPLAWYAQQLPESVKRFMAGGMFVIEFGAPLLMLFPRRPRIIAAYSIIFLQVMIAAFGNYTFFNLLTTAIAVLLLDDQHLARLPKAIGLKDVCLIKKTPKLFREPQRYFTNAFVLILAMLGILRLTQFVPPVQQKLDMLVVTGNALAPLRVTSSYGLFAVMTKTRPEVVIEGSADGKNWETYEFKYKPQALDETPKWVQPYMPRLDWQMWFVGLDGEALVNLEGYQPTPQLVTPFLLQLGQKLLMDKPDVKALMTHTPAQKPKYLRATVYTYRFSSAQEREETGNWWVRKKLAIYLPQVTL